MIHSQRLLRLALAVLGAAAVGASVPPAALAAPSEVRAKLGAAAAPKNELRQVDTTSSLGTRFVRFRQEVGGVPVLGAELVATDAPGRGGDVLVDDTRRAVDAPPDPEVGRERAIDSALRAAGVRELDASPQASLAILPDAQGGRLVLRVLLPARVPRASFEVLIDARSGRSVRVRDVLRHASGTASIFDTSPVVEQGSRTGLSDAGDADSGVPSGLYTPVTLARLSDSTTCLRGSWVRAQLGSSDVCQASRNFTTTRSDDRFEAAMSYFHIDRAQEYIRSLGLTNVFPRPITVHANDFSDDNSYFEPWSNEIALGTGGTDDGEDGEVILHEYGHAVQDDQVEGFGESAQGGAMGEGFGDYLAATIAATYAPNPEFDPCVAEWDSLGFSTPRDCLRRVDRDLTAAQVGPGTACNARVHCAGEAWSGALWDIRAQLGGPTTDRLVIQSHFSLTSTADFHDGSKALLAADRALYGGANQAFLRNLLSSRGLLDLERLDDTFADASPLPVPGTANGQVDAASDRHDVYALSLTAGRGVTLRLRGSGAGFRLGLYRPGASDFWDSSALVAGTAGAAPRELNYTATRTGTHYLDVSPTSGAGRYEVSALRDTDGDTRPDAEDNCPTAANRTQSDWNRNGRGDACDSRAQVTLDRARLRGREVTLVGRARPASLVRPRNWRVRVDRRVCTRSGCRWQAVATAIGARRLSSARIMARLTLPRAGRYRLRAFLVHPRLRAPNSSAKTLSIS